MKKSQITLLLFSVIVSGLIFFSLSRNQKTDEKTTKKINTTVYLPVKTVINSDRIVSINGHGQITPYSEIMLSSEVQGKLLKGNKSLKPGVKFKKGEVLFKIDNTEALYSFAARKAGLINVLIQLLPDIEMEFPSEKSKWIGFMNDLQGGSSMPLIPKFASQKEGLFFQGRSVLTEYYTLKNLESRLMKYQITAPFTGTVTDVFMEPGAIANPGVQIAKLVKTGDYEVIVPISIDELKFFKDKTTTKFEDSDGKLVGYGKIARISDVVNQQTQSIDIYYTFKPEKEEIIYNGMFLNAVIDKEITKNTFIVPRKAIKNNKIGVLIDDKVEFREIKIIGNKPDSLFISGLEDSTVILLEHLNKVDPKIIYKAVNQ